MFNFTPGVVKAPYDPRDFQYSKLVSAIPLPRRFICDLPPLEVKNQFNRGTCVGQAYSSELEELNWKETGIAERLSALYFYAKCKQLDGYPYVEGTDMRIAAKVACDFGCVPERDYPYTTDFTILTTSEEQDIKARFYRTKSYARVNNLAEIKQAIATSKQSVPFGMMLTENFLKTDSNGVILKKPGGNILGGHAMKAFGYDDDARIVYALGSWGKDNPSTVKGIHLIPYDLFEIPSIANDLPIPCLMDSFSFIDMVVTQLPKNVTLSDRYIQLKIDGEFINLDNPAIIITETGRAYFPIRELEKLGFEVIWEDKNSLIHLVRK